MTTVDDMAAKVEQALADAPPDLQAQILERLDRIGAGVDRIGDLMATFLDPPTAVKLVECERCSGEGTLGGTVPCGDCDGNGRRPAP